MRTATKMLTVLGGGGATLSSVLASLNPSAWFEGDRITGYANNDPLDSWVDVSANAFTVSAALDARPLYIASMLNSLPGVRFDGTDDKLTRASVLNLSLAAANKGTTYAILKQDGTQANNILYVHGGTSNQLWLAATLANNLNVRHGNASGGGVVSVAQPANWDNNWHFVEVVRDGASVIVTVDGVDILSSTFSDDLDSESNTLALGNSGASWFKGDTTLITLFKEAHTEAQRDQIRTLVLAKYGAFF